MTASVEDAKIAIRKTFTRSILSRKPFNSSNAHAECEQTLMADHDSALSPADVKSLVAAAIAEMARSGELEISNRVDGDWRLNAPR